LAVGAPGSTRTVEAQGVVHIFELSGGRWEWRQELTHVRARERDLFGEAVALRDGTLVVGRPRARVGSGSAYVFTPDASTVWRQRLHLFPPVGGGFGTSVATDGRWALCGSPDETVGAVESTGAAYIFDLGCILCRADLDGDGELTFFDFLAFQNLFAA